MGSEMCIRDSDSTDSSRHGGAGGGYAKKFLDVSSISTSTITVGAGGTGTTANNTAGGNGGASSWADGTNTITGNGGGGGTTTANTPTAGATGVGGNVRDVCCMGAEVIATTDSFRFGDIQSNKTKWIHDGVVDGIGGYGNPLGIPNIGGDIYYHGDYNDNCLVTLVTLGIVKSDEIFHSYAPKNAEGYDLILIGKPTDNSGFGGASFASLELEDGKKEQNKGAVQEPNAFLERHILKSTYALFDKIKEKDLLGKVGFKDLGAGGVACASIELADTAGYGADIWLDNVHISMQDLHPSVILCSETQERFMWVCHPDITCLLYTSPSPRDLSTSRMPSSA